MKVVLRVDARRGFAWEDELAARLAEHGHAVSWQAVDGAPGWPPLLGLLHRFERLAFRYRGPALHAPRVARPAPGGGEGDLTIDLSGSAKAGDDAIRPLYDGLPDPRAALASLLDGRVPRLSVTRGGRVVEAGLPANERPDVLAAGLDFVFARMVDLLVKAVEISHGGREIIEQRSTVTPVAAWRPAAFALSGLAAKLSARLKRLLTEPPAWRVGFRPASGPPIRETGQVPAEGFVWLPGGNDRYFADPFLFEHQGRLWCFLEEFPYATGTGVLSVVEVGPGGRPIGEPRPVLETGSHLSYPHVFESGGEVWMIPESQAAGEIALYRAEVFPWRWAKERVLVEALAADATPARHDGRLWLFASLQHRAANGAILGSSWDALGLWSAAGLDDDFVPHPANPVLVDAGAARPAGRLWRRGDELMRVAQDCRGGYGAGLARCRVDRLDREGFAQSVESTLGAPPIWDALGLHTLDIADGIEAIDCLRRSPD